MVLPPGSPTSLVIPENVSGTLLSVACGDGVWVTSKLRVLATAGKHVGEVEGVAGTLAGVGVVAQPALEGGGPVVGTDEPGEVGAAATTKAVRGDGPDPS